MSTSLLSPSSAGAAKLTDFSTCELSDALIKLGVSSGGYMPDIHRVSPFKSDTKLVGPAYTVQMVLASDKETPRPAQHFIDTAPKGCVVVVSAPPNTKNAVWGGLMTAGAQARGAIGAIISGRCRDLIEHDTAQFPIFARGRSTVGQSPFTRPGALNVSLTIHPEPADSGFPSVVIEPGDIIIGDVDGVVSVPQALVERVVEVAAVGREVDERCMRDIQAGLGVQESFRKNRGK